MIANKPKKRTTPKPETSREYTAIWAIQVDAGNPVDAAKLALEIQRDPKSIALQFDVMDPNGTTSSVDLWREP